MIGPVKVWRLSPEQIAGYVPGMQLGRPDQIIPYVREKKGVDEVTKARVAKAIKKRMENSAAITVEKYKELSAKGMMDKDIAFKYSIKPGTLANYKRSWRRLGILEEIRR